MYFQSYDTTMPFWKWLLSIKENKIILWISAIAIIVQFIFFKILYPLPNFLPDSYSYLQAAHTNQDINLWPIGYSKFLRFFSSFTHSHTILVFFQYLSLQAAILYLISTIKFLFNPQKWVNITLLTFAIFNPFWFYVGNFVSSDALFASLSIIWFTQLLWIVIKMHNRLLLWHAIVLTIAFTMRFNAIYYPLVSILVIFASNKTWKLKTAGTVYIILFLGSFVFHSFNQYKKLTNTKQIAAFGGWQLAANALYAYSQIQPLDRKPVPNEFKQLHQIVNKHIDSILQLTKRPDSVLGIYYLWDEKAPLKQYLYKKYEHDSTTDGLKRWSSVGPFYGEYGMQLIKTYPREYYDYFIVQNMKNYYAPETEFLGIYNMGKDSIDQQAKDWFLLKTRLINSRFKNKKIFLTEIFPILLATINITFLLSLISFFILNGLAKVGPNFSKLIILTSIIWFFNFIFCLLASPIVLRYQVFPMVLAFSPTILLFSYVLSECKMPKTKRVTTLFHNYHNNLNSQT